MRHPHRALRPLAILGFAVTGAARELTVQRRLAPGGRSSPLLGARKLINMVDVDA